MAAVVASRSNPVIAAHSQKLRAAGKAAKQALTAASANSSSSSTPSCESESLELSTLDNKMSLRDEAVGFGAFPEAPRGSYEF